MLVMKEIIFKYCFDMRDLLSYFQTLMNVPTLRAAKSASTQWAVTDVSVTLDSHTTPPVENVKVKKYALTRVRELSLSSVAFGTKLTLDSVHLIHVYVSIYCQQEKVHFLGGRYPVEGTREIVSLISV